MTRSTHMFLINFFVMLVGLTGCDVDTGGSRGAPRSSQQQGLNADGSVASQEETDPFPTQSNVAEEGKDKGPPGEAGGPGGPGADNCSAVYEDGYWKVWPKGGAKPALPASGPAPAGKCGATTSTDTMGGSTNGQPAGAQRVLLKTVDNCYVPNGGGPVGPLLGACTGKTWKVPY